MKKLTCCLALLAATSVAASANADGAKRLSDSDSSGYGDKVGRVGGSYSMITGTRPAFGAPSLPGTPGARQDFTRSAFDVDFDIMGYWDATRFDTLIGGELSAKLGVHTNEKTDPEAKDDPKKDNSKIFLRMDMAADYALIHWGGSFRGRIAFGAGFGFDYDSPKWYTDGGRFYPLLIGRLQLWGGDAFGLHFAYHHVPTTANDKRIREHRFEGGLGMGALHAGLRFVMTRVLADDVPNATADFESRELGGYVAYAF